MEFATLRLKQWVPFHHYCPCQEARPALTEEDIQRGPEKRGSGWNAENVYRGEKRHCRLNMRIKWWKLYKSVVLAKEHLRESFPYERALRQGQLLNRKKSGASFGYVQCDIKLPEHVSEQFAIFSPILNNTNVCRQNTRHLLQEYAEKERLMNQSRRNLISSVEQTNGTIITPLPLFYWELGLVGAKVLRFVERTSVKCFNNFVQSDVNARRQVFTDRGSNSVTRYIVMKRQIQRSTIKRS